MDVLDRPSKLLVPRLPMHEIISAVATIVGTMSTPACAHQIGQFFCAVASIVDPDFGAVEFGAPVQDAIVSVFRWSKCAGELQQRSRCYAGGEAIGYSSSFSTFAGTYDRKRAYCDPKAWQ